MNNNIPHKIVIPTKPAISHGLHPGGRPSYTLTEEQKTQIAILAAKGVSMPTIAASLGIPKDNFVVNTEFSALYQKHYAEASIRVHHRQYELLENDGMPGTTMAIWLGKQHCGQTDRSIQEIKSEIRVDINIYAQSYLSQIAGQEAKLIEGEVRELPEPGTGESQMCQEDKKG